MRIKRTFLSLILYASLASVAAHAAAIIQYEVTPLSPGQSRYTYHVSGFPFMANQELDILFAPELFGALLNGVAGPDFDVMLFQPDDPPGRPGHYSALALIDNASTLTSFSVEFTFIGSGQPGSQPFVINQYDHAGWFISTIGSGVTSPMESSTIPEPDFFAVSGLMLAVCGWLAVRRRRIPTA
jgi:hypothetical protein